MLLLMQKCFFPEGRLRQEWLSPAQLTLLRGQTSVSSALAACKQLLPAPETSQSSSRSELSRGVGGSEPDCTLCMQQGLFHQPWENEHGQRSQPLVDPPCPGQSVKQGAWCPRQTLDGFCRTCYGHWIRSQVSCVGNNTSPPR